MSHETPQRQIVNHAEQGQLFGRYRLRGIIGQGGMGRLYVAEQIGIEGFSKIVALKRILPHLADSQHFRAMFLNEARVAARLEHPNIVATFELGEVDGNYFISMEYLSGEDLATVLARCKTVGPMPLEIAAALAQQSANGLHYAHELRDPSGKAVELVHRDVSPLNIFVTYYGMVKLLDFGIVRSAPEGARTVPGVFKGKYAYCAPEQLEGGSIDRQTDLFCLGIVLWECLTGRSLFLRNNDAGTIDAVRGLKIEPPSVYRKDVPRELDQIVMQALSRDKTARFQTAHACSEALDRFLLRREHRPTSKSIGIWMESLFGSQRATLKKAIAQGSEVEAALKLLPAITDERAVTSESTGGAGSRSVAGASAQPRMLWSSKPVSAPGNDPRSVISSVGAGAVPMRPPTSSSPPHDSPFPQVPPLANVIQPRHDAERTAAKASRTHQPDQGRRDPSRDARTRSWLIAGVAVAAVATGALVIRGGLRSPSGVAASRVSDSASLGSIEIRSDPPGAQVFVNGDPSGLITPATLTGLSPGHSIEIRLDKVGHSPVTERIEVKTGQTRLQTFRLTEALGTIVFEGLPLRAVIYANDNLVEGRGPLSLPIGKQRIRVETASGVLMSRTIEVAPGSQTVQVAGAGAKSGAKSGAKKDVTR